MQTIEIILLLDSQYTIISDLFKAPFHATSVLFFPFALDLHSHFPPSPTPSSFYMPDKGSEIWIFFVYWVVLFSARFIIE